MSLNSCAVFCGSRNGISPAYTEDARAIGKALAQHGLTLIYGGGKTGLMGHVADAVLAAGGKVKGIIPDFLKESEIMHEGVTDLVITQDMPSRKAQLFELADAYIILPGGFGTFDEFSEVLVNRQIGLHNKPIIILNSDNWAKPMLTMLETSVKQGLADVDSHDLYSTASNVNELMALLLKTNEKS